MSDTQASSEKLVRGFLGAWEGRNLDTICSAFADRAVYHNVPVKPIFVKSVTVLKGDKLVK